MPVAEEVGKIKSYCWGNPAGLRLMQEMQAEAEPEPVMSGEAIETRAALNAEQAELIADELHALAEVPGDAPPPGSMFEKWSNWAA